MKGMPPMNKREIVEKLAEGRSVRKTEVKSMVDDFLKYIVDVAASGGEVSLPGFGKFKVKARPEREGQDPTSGKKITIAASRTLAFEAAKPVKELLNG